MRVKILIVILGWIFGVLLVVCSISSYNYILVGFSWFFGSCNVGGSGGLFMVLGGLVGVIVWRLYSFFLVR